MIDDLQLVLLFARGFVEELIKLLKLGSRTPERLPPCSVPCIAVIPPHFTLAAGHEFCFNFSFHRPIRSLYLFPFERFPSILVVVPFCGKTPTGIIIIDRSLVNSICPVVPHYEGSICEIIGTIEG